MTRSLTTGWCGRGAIEMVEEEHSSQPLVQARVLRPSMFIEHEPQMPSRHERRNDRVGSISFLMWIRASSSIGPWSSAETS